MLERFVLPQVPNCLKSRSLDGVYVEEDEPSQSSKLADRQPLQRMFPATYGARLLQVRREVDSKDNLRGLGQDNIS